MIIQQASVLDAEFGMKMTALPHIVLCGETYNPKLSCFSRQKKNAGNPLRLYDSLKLFIKQGTIENTILLQQKVDWFSGENKALLEKVEGLEAELEAIRHLLDVFKV